MGSYRVLTENSGHKNKHPKYGKCVSPKGLEGREKESPLPQEGKFKCEGMLYGEPSSDQTSATGNNQ